MINALVSDLTRQSARNIADSGVQSLDEVRRGPALIAFSPAIEREQQELKHFLRDRLYRHYRVQRMSAKSRRIITDLFQAFMHDHKLLPPQDQERARIDAPRAIADYIAGMTDRYAIREHRRLFSVEESG